ncbi:hypothetical protein PHYPSEUDO_013757 [Phytophthora pseudosyringae]|uniref:Uncharacterized protein n=1 Tax=Phytophthora pseudosyringae TaxID=221518 RepID=A0A8T1W1K3_9STRA|nr:hypothetical protein PHYPSEUDO_013757 [Phytophthora pseudosyringae]
MSSTLEKVVDVFDLSTDAMHAKFIEFNTDVLDGHLLDRYKQSQRGDTSKMLNANQITINWFAVDASSKLLKNRDFVTVECSGSFLDVSSWKSGCWSSLVLLLFYFSIKVLLVFEAVYHTDHAFVESKRPGFLDVIFSTQAKTKGNGSVAAKAECPKSQRE